MIHLLISIKIVNLLLKDYYTKLLMSIESNLKKIVNLENNSVNKLNPKLHTLIRLDGHGFSKMVKKMKLTKPFDDNFTQAMKLAAIDSMDFLNCSLCFIGSDEITYWIKSLTKEQIDKGSDLPFSGRIQKIVSLMSGRVSTSFSMNFGKLIGWELIEQCVPHFDCRVWQVDTSDQVLDNIKERITFTMKNSRMMFAQNYLTQKELNGISSKDAVQKLLETKSIDYYEQVSPANRVGTVIYWSIEQKDKEIEVIGDINSVSFTRRVRQIVNLGPSELDKLNTELFIFN